MKNKLLRHINLISFAGFLIVAAGCGNDNQPEPVQAQAPPEQTPMAQMDQAPVAVVNSAAGVTWTPPERWQAQPERPMRVATYAVPAAEGDPEPGECAVFFFGAGQGGSIDLNVSRWRDQFSGPDGKTAGLNQQKSTINGLTVHSISVSGTYLASMGPMFQSGAAKKPGFKMLGAIIEAPEGNVFIKITGPEKTIDGAEAEFRTMLASLKK